MKKPKIGIIGAGMTGIVCARNLSDAGYEPIIFEKSRGIGGRMATRRTSNGLQFDHGAQYITAKSKHFQSFIDSLIASGHAANWKIGGKNTIVGNPSMNAMLESVVKGISLRFNEEIKTVDKTKDGWMISTEDKNWLFDIVVLALPAPQIMNLLGREVLLSEKIDDVKMAPCLTLMAAFSSDQATPFITHRGVNDDIAWIAQDSAKPGRLRDITCWVAQAGDDWSRKHLELDKVDLVRILTPMLCERLGISASDLVYSSAHRWRYSKVTVPLGQPFIPDVSETLYLGGDWAIDARVEAAWESGIAISKDILERLA